MATRTLGELQQLQALPLNVKVAKTQQRIREWVDHWGLEGVCVSFSGGKDSTVLLDIARKMYPNIKAVFVDTGLEFPEIRDFVKTYENVDWLRPKMNFMKVIETYGFPMISKEVSECVDGARKYVKALTDRQTDRQTDRLPYAQFFRKLNGTGEYSKFSECPSNENGGANTNLNLTNCADMESMLRPTRGGQDNKYRKLRGIGEYSKSTSTESHRTRKKIREFSVSNVDGESP